MVFDRIGCNMNVNESTNAPSDINCHLIDLKPYIHKSIYNESLGGTQLVIKLMYHRQRILNYGIQVWRIHTLGRCREL